jgi:phosphoribosylamine--glycine ligase
METAEDFIRNHEGPWVVKHDTHYSALSFIGERKDGRDVISALSKLFNRNAVVTLQTRVKGVEVAVGRYFNGVDWFGPVNVNHEHKHLCNNDIGPLTPEMGTVLNFTTEREPIYERTLKKLKPLLADIGYRGYFDINFIVNEHNIWPLEATARFGTPITELQVDMLQSSLATFLSALARGEGHTPVFSNGFGVTVSLAIPPFPYSIDRIGNDFLDDQMTQIFFADDLSADDLSHIHFEEVKRLHQPSGVYGPGYYWAGDNGWVMHITGHALTIPAAQENVYRLIDKIYLPLKFYRTDIGDRVLRRDLPLLREWGLLN